MRTLPGVSLILLTHFKTQIDEIDYVIAISKFFIQQKRTANMQKP